MSTVAKLFIFAGLFVLALNVNGAAVFGLILVAVGFLVPNPQTADASAARVEALEQYIRKLHRWIVEREAARTSGASAADEASSTPDAPVAATATPEAVNPWPVPLDVAPDPAPESTVEAEEAPVSAASLPAPAVEEPEPGRAAMIEAAAAPLEPTDVEEVPAPATEEPAHIDEDADALPITAHDAGPGSVEEVAPPDIDEHPADDAAPLAFPQPATSIDEPEEEDSEPETAAAAFSPVTPLDDRPATLPPRATIPPVAPRPEKPRRSLFDFEQILGTNWLAKVGVAILVIGVSFFLAWQLRELGPAGKVTVGAIVGLAMLGTGIWFERNERYRVLARAVLGGGWALLFSSAGPRTM